jgi:eukaryotic-like serine/threonine-protein kinase
MEPLKATVAFGAPGANPAEVSAHAASGSVMGTLTGYVRDKASPAPPAMIDIDATLDGEVDVDVSAFIENPTSTDVRTTVLPRRVRAADGAVAPRIEPRPRFDRVRTLGEGAVGTVELARDNDIRRTVAVKRLREEVRSDGTLLRFADEVRIVGQLEHPNIVPVYDVGRDESGDVYLVMKHLEGETMEEVIEKLRAGDPAYVARFPPEFRAHLFLSVIDAVRYAHARGIIHRDLKPANIMIGPYDEVTVMDWGIAKPIRKGEAPSSKLEAAPTLLESADGRLLETQAGTLAGTPYYMSPEQAAGLTDSLDERSDVYALGMVFYEWLVLTHPLAEKKTLIEVLGTIVTQDHDQKLLVQRASSVGAPIEYVYLIMRALRREVDARTASADAMYQGLKDLLDGRIPSDCPVTFAKRTTHTLLRWVDRHPALTAYMLLSMAAGATVGLGVAAWTAVTALL